MFSNLDEDKENEPFTDKGKTVGTFECSLYFLTIRILREGHIKPDVKPWTQTIPMFCQDDQQALEQSLLWVGFLTRENDIPVSSSLRSSVPDPTVPSGVSFGPIVTSWENPSLKRVPVKSEGGIFVFK